MRELLYIVLHFLFFYVYFLSFCFILGNVFVDPIIFVHNQIVGYLRQSVVLFSVRFISTSHIAFYHVGYTFILIINLFFYIFILTFTDNLTVPSQKYCDFMYNK